MPFVSPMQTSSKAHLGCKVPKVGGKLFKLFKQHKKLKLPMTNMCIE